MNFPVALSIAGSDNSAGAGVQADLKSFSALGVYGITAITCVVAEVPGKVSAIHPIPPEIVAEQIRLCLRAYPVAAVKTGMLFSSAVISAVVDTLTAEFTKTKQPPYLVVDPVMIATSGDPLLQKDALAIYLERLFPLASLITPNLDEVQTLLGSAVRTLEQMRAAAVVLVEKFHTAFLVKGGHLGGEAAIDVLLEPGGTIQEFTAPFVPGVSTHGTGCTYSAAITAGLAKGLPLAQAVGEAKNYVTRAISNFHRWTHASGQIDALNHFPAPQ